MHAGEYIVAEYYHKVQSRLLHFLRQSQAKRKIQIYTATPRQ